MSILFATDCSPCSRTAVQLAAALARQEGHPLTLVHAIPHSIGYAPRQPDQALLWQTNRVTMAEAMLATEANVRENKESTYGPKPRLVTPRA